MKTSLKPCRTSSKKLVIKLLDAGWRICSRRQYLFGRLCWSNLLYPLDACAGMGSCYSVRTSVVEALYHSGDLEVCGSMNGKDDMAGTVDRFFRRSRSPGDKIVQHIVSGSILGYRDSFRLDEATVARREIAAELKAERDSTDAYLRLKAATV